jgi:hypothetical protein
MKTQMSEESSHRTWYIKGFKLDSAKIEQYGYPLTEEDPHNTRYYQRIISVISSTAYKYIGAGFEENGDMVLVIVMDDGWDKVELQNKEMPVCDRMLAQAAERVLTSGIWRRWD